MQFLDAIGLAYFWEKIKNWVGKNYLSLKGGILTDYLYFKGGAGILAKESDESVEFGLTASFISASAKGENGKLKETFTVEAATGNVLCGESTASKFVKTNGTAIQVLMADGSVRTLNTSYGIAGLDANGNVPLANLGNLDTTVAEVVTALPTSNIKRHIYLVKDSDTANNKYAEYVYTGDISAAYDSTKWEKLGDFRATVDLANYAKTADVNTALAKKVDVVSGKGLSTNDFTAAYKSKLDGITPNANNYSLPLAANGTRGGIQVGYAANGRNYPVQLSGEKAYVNVPWTDTNTTYDLSPYAKKMETVDFSSIRLYKQVIANTPQGLKEKQVILFSTLGDNVKSGEIVLEEATSNMSGLMSIRDKNKLDYIANGATADSAITTTEIDALFA